MLDPERMTGKIIWGDCLPILKRMPDKSVDLILTDPPYGINKMAWDDRDSWVLTMGKFGRDIGRILKDDGILIMFSSIRNIDMVLYAVKIPYRWQFIWYASNNMQHGDIGFCKYTPVLIFSRRNSIYVEAQDLRAYPIPSKSVSELGHETQKPIDLIKYLVDKFSNEDDLILDPFAGSCTTAVACHELNRKWIMVEKSLRYVGLARRRLDAVIAQGRLFDTVE